MEPAVQKFQGKVSAYIPQQAVVAHAEAIHGVVSPWIPTIYGSHGAGIGSDQRRERKDAMAIVAAGAVKVEITA